MVSIACVVAAVDSGLITPRVPEEGRTGGHDGGTDRQETLCAPNNLTLKLQTVPRSFNVCICLVKNPQKRFGKGSGPVFLLSGGPIRFVAGSLAVFLTHATKSKAKQCHPLRKAFSSVLLTLRKFLELC